MSESTNNESTITVTPEDLLRVAKLVKVEIDEAKVDTYCSQLSEVISWFGVLSEVDTTNIEPMRYGWSTSQKHLQMREDVVTEGNIKDEVLSSSVTSHMGCFTVRRVV